jgi:uncharacterized membrane protein YiaA
MKKNVGKTDKALRLVIAIALFAIGLTADVGTALKAVVFIFSGVAFFTALFGT